MKKDYSIGKSINTEFIINGVKFKKFISFFKNGDIHCEKIFSNKNEIKKDKWWWHFNNCTVLINIRTFYKKRVGVNVEFNY